jgi:hypothetical protein
MNVINMKKKQKEWHPATKPLIKNKKKPLNHSLAVVYALKLAL